jgi:hypothetical protein
MNENLSIHIHLHIDGESKILEKLEILTNKTNTIMSKQDEINAAIAEISDATTAIAARIEALINGGLDTITEESLAALQVEADALKAIGNPPPKP